MKFTAHQRRRVCVAAPCDERTFDKWARERGGVSELSRVRIERAIRELDFASPDDLPRERRP